VREQVKFLSRDSYEHGCHPGDDGFKHIALRLNDFVGKRITYHGEYIGLEM
jgi:hypothetical protein